MKQALFIGAIASVLSINAFATTSTVTSRDYVDAQDALKQDTIPEAGVNADENGGGESVVTYTDTAGTIGERWICDAELYGYDDCVDNNLVTLDLLESATNNVVNNLPTRTVTYKTCYEWSGTPHTDANCILWNLSDRKVKGCIESGITGENVCQNYAQCCSRMCVNGYCTEPQY